MQSAYLELSLSKVFVTKGDYERDIMTIKIDTHKKSSPLKERAYKKLVLKVEDNFENPIIQLDDEQDKKLDDFRDYIRKINQCLYCKKYVPEINFHASDDYTELKALCMDCMMYIVDSSQYVKDFIKDFQKIISECGYDFKDGFPEMLKHEKRGKWCKDCNDYHTKMEFINFRNE